MEGELFCFLPPRARTLGSGYLGNRRTKIRTPPQHDHEKNWTHYKIVGSSTSSLQQTVAKIAFIPDCNVTPLSRSLTSCHLTSKEGVSDFASAFAPHKIDLISLPNIYELNDKRYEIRWLSHMSALRLHDYDMVIADTGSAEALLRYLESNLFQCIGVALDAPDLYTAGERHGRAFRYSLIKDNTKARGIHFARFCEANRSLQIGKMLDDDLVVYHQDNDSHFDREIDALAALVKYVLDAS